jgi:hypothetical protein
VRACIDDAVASGGHLFASTKVLSNPSNFGTCRTCMVAVDYAAARHDRIILTEDDTLFSCDTFKWFESAFALDSFKSEDVWAISGESIFFDAQDRILPEDYAELARKYAVENALGHSYIKFNFVPSTCFGTTAEKWKEFGSTRGLPLGDEDVCKRCASEQKFCLFPIVPRVADLGMLHPDGYSVLIHSAAGVTSIKSTYLSTDDLPPNEIEGDLVAFSGDAGELWRRTTLLEGFGQLP